MTAESWLGAVVLVLGLALAGLAYWCGYRMGRRDEGARKGPEKKPEDPGAVTLTIGLVDNVTAPLKEAKDNLQATAVRMEKTYWRARLGGTPSVAPLVGIPDLSHLMSTGGSGFEDVARHTHDTPPDAGEGHNARKVEPLKAKPAVPGRRSIPAMTGHIVVKPAGKAPDTRLARGMKGE